ncbi:MAG: 2-oxoglutarate dehydrogenase E1 component [Bacteroidales bacterium]|nr:2-oxoglutarate dehydrogenase E1 component [Bacteroidales bacterium]MBN2697587.1 2-oxoglutarate dehydrogenase E1 component [Bacteroidales bacterium]
MDDLSFLQNLDTEALEQLYRDYRNDPDSIDKSWHHFFQGFDLARKDLSVPDSESLTFDKEFKVLNLINGYRKRGHLFTRTNPVRTRRKYFPTLDLENFDLSEADLDIIFHAGAEIGIGRASLRDIVHSLKKTYCGHIGSEYMFIRHPEKIKWLRERIESNQNQAEFSAEQKKEIYHHLKEAVGFEKFIHKKFVGQKRFSIEGTEVLIPALNHLIENGALLGIREVNIGMAHRGRLNVLANVLKKPNENIFKEFEGESYEERIALGDVKYHLGYGNTIRTKHGHEVIINIVPNPSHLESSYPIIEGVSRARIENRYNGDHGMLLPVIIHGDAAIAGQGVVYEVIQMSELEGYRTGGTLHFVINNQVGFTTNYLDARSSTYCTDVGKVIKAPIWHVNGDDAEGLLHVVRMAIAYRQTFHTDVFIDILAYRRYGHNEGDEPRFTQPLLYKSIASHPNLMDIYGERLVKEGIMTAEEKERAETVFEQQLEQQLEQARKLQKVHIQQFLESSWANYRYADHEDFNASLPTGVPETELRSIAGAIHTLPGDKNFYRKTIRLMEERMKMIGEDRLDWALGELLAYATLLKEGHPVRISGQDSVRGTFSHRHAGLVLEDSGETYIPLQHLDSRQAPFQIYNSPLNEYGVMGFEYGYSLASPEALTIWEAQFGDFVNVAQVIVDQYISSAEEKWGVMSGLVLFLPHGFEGQGPEHSSARIERFLALAARNNIHLVNPTTPANMFHVLRQHLKRKTRVPLVIFTPKSLLRHPRCVSTFGELETGRFMQVYDDPDTDLEEVRRVVFCSGKVYYDLLARKQALKARDIALIRIEQIFPFPLGRVREILKKYRNNMLTLWVQEEPENMGAWYYVQNLMKGMDIIPVTRMASGSPATGLHKLHEISQVEIIDKVFRKCTCELQNVYCGLQCVIGSSRKEILKQHYYFDTSSEQ